MTITQGTQKHKTCNKDVRGQLAFISSTFSIKISTTSCIQDLSDINTNGVLNDLLIKIISLWMVWQQMIKKYFWGTSEWLYYSF